MSQARCGESNSVAMHDQSNTAIRVADWLCLAAAPIFATMAVLTVVLDGGPPDTLCSAMDAFPLNGMVPMYLLMSAFHSVPWLKLISDRRNIRIPSQRPLLRMLESKDH